MREVGLAMAIAGVLAGVFIIEMLVLTPMLITKVADLGIFESTESVGAKCAISFIFGLYCMQSVMIIRKMAEA